MKRSLMICAALMMLLVPQVQADNITLTLDLKNALKADPLGGGTWQLYARRIETGGAPEGNHGIAGIRALINNIDVNSIVYAAGTSNVDQTTFCNGGPCYQTLGNGTVEIVYTQNTSATPPAPVVTGVGVFADANNRRDVLIASGSWPAGPRPTWGNDGSTEPGGPFTSDANFLGAASAPFGNSVAPGSIATEIYTLGDLNVTGINAGRINNLDAVALIPQLPPATAPYNAAADINQTGANAGVINNLDAVAFLAILGGPSAAAVGAVPEPSTLGLAMLATMGLIARRRRA